MKIRFKLVSNNTYAHHEDHFAKAIADANRVGMYVTGAVHMRETHFHWFQQKFCILWGTRWNAEPLENFVERLQGCKVSAVTIFGTHGYQETNRNMLNLFEHFCFGTPHIRSSCHSRHWKHWVEGRTPSCYAGGPGSTQAVPCRSPARGVATRTCPRPCRHVGSHSGWWQQLNIDQGSSLNSTPKKQLAGFKSAAWVRVTSTKQLLIYSPKFCSAIT